MNLGVLFSGGKDSTYAAFLAKKSGNKLACLISIFSENPDSYMFHTPNINLVKHQAKLMNLPIIIKKTKGEKEVELIDLERAVKKAKEKYKIEGIVSGAIASKYQLDRVNRICKKLGLESIAPLWQKPELEYLNKLINDKFKIIITAVSAYPLDKSWLGKEINEDFVRDITKLNQKYKIHVAGEGGEFETLVIDCPLFKEPLKVKSEKISGENNSWRLEVLLD